MHALEKEADMPIFIFYQIWLMQMAFLESLQGLFISITLNTIKTYSKFHTNYRFGMVPAQVKSKQHIDSNNFLSIINNSSHFNSFF